MEISLHQHQKGPYLRAIHPYYLQDDERLLHKIVVTLRGQLQCDEGGEKEEIVTDVEIEKSSATERP